MWDFRGFDAGLNLKSSNGWFGGGNGSNLSGFSALPSGQRNNIPGFYDLGRTGYWWAALSVNSNSWFTNLDCNAAGVAQGAENVGSGFSARCLRN